MPKVSQTSEKKNRAKNFRVQLKNRNQNMFGSFFITTIRGGGRFYHNVNIYICKLLVHRKVVTVFDFLPFKFYSNCIPSLTGIAAAGLSGTEIETADISIANKRYFNSFYEKLLLVLEDLDWEWCHHLQR